MDSNIIQGFQSKDYKAKLIALQKCIDKLSQKSTFLLEFSSDTKTKLISTGISLIKDANPKCSLLAYDFLVLMMKHYESDFLPFSNMTFDLLINKFSDPRQIIRDKTNDTMLFLVKIISITQGVERLLQNLDHKNQKTKVQILGIINYYCKIDPNSLKNISNMVKSMALLLNDPYSPIRQLANDSLSNLYQTFGEEIIKHLKDKDYVKQSHILQIIEGGNKPQTQMLAIESKSNPIDDRYIESSSHHSPTAPMSRTSQPIVTNKRRSLSASIGIGHHHHHSPLFTSPKTNPPGKSEQNGRAIFNSLPIPTQDAQDTSSTYHSNYIFSLLVEGNNIQSREHFDKIIIFTDKELSASIQKIASGLGKADDWQERIKALKLLQGICLGMESPLIPPFISFIKTHHILICNQVMDLRSAVAKEACRTVALMADTLKQHFAPLCEYWWISLTKQLNVKFQIISSAADRCIRIIIESCMENKLLPPLLDVRGCLSKNSIIRKYCYEYLCLVCALWRRDLIERNWIPIKQVIRHGVVDADADVRQNARSIVSILFHRVSVVTSHGDQLRSEYVFRHQVEAMFNEPDQMINESSMKKLRSEVNNLTHELAELLQFGNQRENGSISIDKTNVVDSNAIPSSMTESVKSAPVRSNTRSHSTNSVMSGYTTHSNLTTESAPTLSSTSTQPSVKLIVGKSQSDKVVSTHEESHVTNSYQKYDSEYTRVEDNAPLRASNNRRESFLQGGAVRIKPKSSLMDGDKVAPMDSYKAKNEFSTQRLTGSIVTQPMAKSSNGLLMTHNHDRTRSNSLQPSSSSLMMFHLDTVISMVDDVQWSNRMQAFESMNQRLQRAINDHEKLSPIIIETFLDCSLKILPDPHLKVALEAVHVLCACVENFKSACISKLGVILSSLFQRLADKRNELRDECNRILNTIRTLFDPVVLITALSPKLIEIPDRMKTASMQFLSAIAAHCEAYFANPQHAWVFLGRMANILSDHNGQKKPSSALIIHGSRLLELIYRTCPKVISQQISALPMQQQNILKKLLSTSIPDIESNIIMANRSEWIPSRHIRNNPELQRETFQIDDETTLEKDGLSTTSLSDHLNHSVHEVLDKENQNSTSFTHPNIMSSYPYSPPPPPPPLSTMDWAESPASMTAQVEELHGSNFYDFIAKRSTDVLMPSEAFQVVTSVFFPTLPNPPKSSEVELDNIEVNRSSSMKLPSNESSFDRLKREMIEETFDAYHQVSIPSVTLPKHLQVNEGMISLDPLVPVDVYIQNHDDADQSTPMESTIMKKLEAPDMNESKPKSIPLATHLKDGSCNILWLLHSLHPMESGSLDMGKTYPNVKGKDSKQLLDETNYQNKVKALKELKVLARNKDDAFWSGNCSQIVSVLLEAFSFHSLGSSLVASSPMGGHLDHTSEKGARHDEKESLSCIYLRSNQYPGGGDVNDSEASNGLNKETNHVMDNLTIACKCLMLLVKHQGHHVKNQMELMVMKLCPAMASVPLAITLQIEMMFIQLAPHDPVRLCQLIYHYASDVNRDPTLHPVRLLSLHVIQGSILHMTSHDVLYLLPITLPILLPNLNSDVVDIRKGIIFLLVEMYLIIGDALYPFIANITPAQKKLFTIYVQRKLEDRQQPSNRIHSSKSSYKHGT